MNKQINFTIEQITDDDVWDNLVLQCPNYSFLNSSARLKYNCRNYKNSGRFEIKKRNEFIALCNWFVSNSRFPFLYTQHSPSFKDSPDKETLMSFIIDELKKIAMKNNCVYIELAPLIKSRIGTKEGILAPVANIDALVTLHIDVSQNLESLRMNMSASCKNVVNKLSKDSKIEIKVFNDDSQINLFLKLLRETQKDKGFTGKSDEKFREEFQNYAEKRMLYFIVGYFEGEPIGMRVNVRYGNVLTDYQACISSQAREQNIRIAYLLAYKTMLLAKDLGCNTWDMFGGMSVDNAKNHPWKGIEEFKTSFGGKKIIYAHPEDISIKPTYFLSYIYRYILTNKHKFTTKW